MTSSSHNPWKTLWPLVAGAALVILAAPATALAGDSPEYRWDEGRNPQGANRCSSNAECDGARTCSQYGWCQGVARGPHHRHGQGMSVPGGAIFIRSRLDGQVLDIRGANRAPAAEVIAFPAKGSPNQLWELVPSDTAPYYFIRSTLNGFVLDIKGGNRAPGTPVIAFPQKSSGSENQQWEIVPSREGPYYFLRSRMNGFVLDIRGANRAPGTQIIAFPQKEVGAQNQLWEFAASDAYLERPAPPPPPPPVVVPPPPPVIVPPPVQPPPGTQLVEAGPIWNEGDARHKCPRVCGGAQWTGQWRTTVPNRMSVCECAAAMQPPQQYVPPPPPAQQARDVEAGPLWNQGDADRKCPRVCAPPSRWNGQWRTTVPGRMSVCSCVY